MATSITVQHFDGDYSLHLCADGVALIERTAGVGVIGLYRQLTAARYRDANKREAFAVTAPVGVVREIVRQALLGGNGGRVEGRFVMVMPDTADALLDHYCAGQEADPVSALCTLAIAALHALIFGFHVDGTPIETRAFDIHHPLEA